MLLPVVVSLLLALAILPSASSNAAPTGFADSAFQQVWERTDAPVMLGEARRSWYWGPQPGKTINEPYAQGRSGQRLVQYFDKARMEINDPNGDRSSQWFVTTGLLVAEMVSGKQQVGEKQFVRRQPAEIAIGGDGLLADPDAPTYASFYPVASLANNNRAPKQTGQTVSATINRAGQVGNSPALSLYPGAKLVAYENTLGHNIPQAMWDFLNLKGTVRQDGKSVQGQTLANWVFVMGYPITEPYWTRLKINGIYYDALAQLYERRSLTYIPSFPKGWQVQMGNVGQHYYRWLYGGPLPPPLALQPTASVEQAGIPASVDATVSPSSVETGSPVFVSISGFRPGESIVSWFTAPDGTATDARLNLTAAQDGSIEGVAVTTLGLYPGTWAITFHGRASSHESIAYFALTAPSDTPTLTPWPSSTTPTGSTSTPTALPTRPHPAGSVTPSPTYPSVPTQPPGGLVLSVQPGYGSPDTQFTFLASGLLPNEQAQVTFTDPNGNTLYPAGSNNGQYNTDSQGQLSLTLVPSQAFPSPALGTWLVDVRGQQSGLEGIIGFTVQ